MLSAKAQSLIESLNTLTEQELEALRTAIGAELMERDLSQNGAESTTESRASLAGDLHPAPVAKSKIRANERQVKDTWEWTTVRVACGECGGQGWKKTLLDGELCDCQACDRRGWLELTVPVLRCPECGGPADERVMTGMRCGRCTYGG